jgi:glycosyltransferase involved in cell wall biosynthesis
MRNNNQIARISVVTPTLRRPQEVAGLLHNLAEQSLLPTEVILVDGAPETERATEQVVKEMATSLPFTTHYIRHSGGTAIQRNVGIEAATGNFIAFVDDDVRLDPAFLHSIYAVFSQDNDKKIGGVVGYRTSHHFKMEDMPRWRWYRKLNLLTTYEPGHYDFHCGYPINANMQPSFSGTREVDFMTTSCAMWRYDVFKEGLRFDPFFRDYGVLEDAHLSLRAGKHWQLLQCGNAICVELASPNSRENQRKIGYKQVVNYYYVFQDIGHPLLWKQKVCFWRYQLFELLRMAASTLRRQRKADIENLIGRVEGVLAVMRGRAF